MDAQRAGKKAVQAGQSTAESVQESRVYRVAVKVGLVAYGIVHLLIGWLAVRLAFGESGADASNTGALREIAKTPGGVILLWVIGIGLLTLVLWQLVALFVGYREFKKSKRLRKRASAATRAVLFGYLGVAAIRTALGPDSEEGEDAQESLSASLMGMPGGQIIVGLIGLGILAFGVRQIVKGLKEKYNEELDTRLTGAARWFARVGHIAKGIAVGVVGGLFVWAAFTYDPEKAGGLDQALQTVREQPFGMVLLVVLGVGIACYGFWCFFHARHAKHA